MKELPIADIFLSLQGEGHNAGMPSWFIRIAGCNVGCEFCDEKKAWNKNNFKTMNLEEIFFPIQSSQVKNLVVTGGEPTMYDLTDLTKKAKTLGLKTFLETSGVNEITGQWDWICVSPKQNKEPLLSSLTKANELKVIIEEDKDLTFAEKMKSFTNPTCLYYLQPQWTEKEKAIEIIYNYILAYPIWQLSLQTHKYLNIK
ncbi:MAG: 7-carboxy-7-deazaguanine synthase QueE [Bacteroidales bacterium]|nr:7-carboxy-7-deazaguanine synthase QueE [Bacteroidales bacterium]